MIEIRKAFEKLTFDDIKKFEVENNVKFTERIATRVEVLG